jgi:LmbE family N-acetylglucosaminyl deacetylase
MYQVSGRTSFFRQFGINQMALVVLLMLLVSLKAWCVEGEWTRIPWGPTASPMDISSSAGKMWAIDVNGKIYEFNGSAWVLRPGNSGKYISVSPDGDVWLVNTVGKIYRWVSGSWQQISGEADDISAARGGVLFAVESDGTPKQFTSPGQQWTRLPGKLVNIAAAPNGEAWGYNSTHLIYKWVHNQWQSIPAPSGVGALADLSVGDDGTVLLVNSAGNIWNWVAAESRWNLLRGDASRVSVVNINNVVVINHGNGSIWQLARRSSIDMLVVHAHPDDEGIFGGGILPVYAQAQGRQVAELAMVSRNANGSAPLTSGSRNRMQELRNADDVYAGQLDRDLGLYAPGLYRTGNILLIDGGFVDTGCCGANPDQSWGKNGRGWGTSSAVTQVTPGFGNTVGMASGREAAAWVIARTIRRYHPLVLVSVHNFTGDYGHSNHTATAIGVVDGARLAADATVDIDGLEPWQVRKLYVRGSPDTNYYVDGDPAKGRIVWGNFTPANSVNGFFHLLSESARIAGSTPREVTNVGLLQHISQGREQAATVFAATRFDPNYSEWWTLYSSTVGADSLSTFLVPGDRSATRYQQWGSTSFFDHLLIPGSVDANP